MLHGGNGTVTVTAASGLSAGTHTLEFYRQTIVAKNGIGIYRDNSGSTTNTMPNVQAQDWLVGVLTSRDHFAGIRQVRSQLVLSPPIEAH
jgi:hypothetical protein